MIVKKACPTCLKAISFNDLYECIKCPWCKSRFHPEYAKKIR